MFQRYLKLKTMESMTISINIIYYPIYGFDCIKCALDDFHFLEILSTTETTVPVGSENRKKYFIYGEQWTVNSKQCTGNVHWILIANFECYLFSCHELTLVNLYVKVRLVFLLYLSLVVIVPIVHIITNHRRVRRFWKSIYLSIITEFHFKIGKIESMMI